MHKLAYLSFLLPSLAMAMIAGTQTPGDSTFGKRTVLLISGDSNRCTGTLISRRLVLTAAHCLPGDATAYTAVFTTDLTNFLQGKEKVAVRHVQQSFINPKFDRSELRDDLAIALLEAPAPDEAGIAPLPDSEQNIADGATITALGFGLQNRQGILYPMLPTGNKMPWEAVQLRQKDFTVSPAGPDIQKFFKQDVSYHRLHVSQPEGGICVGDSGGPVYWERANAEPLLIAVNGAVFTQAGSVCGVDALVNRIDTGLDFIRSVMAEFPDPAPTK